MGTTTEEKEKINDGITHQFEQIDRDQQAKIEAAIRSIVTNMFDHVFTGAREILFNGEEGDEFIEVVINLTNRGILYSQKFSPGELKEIYDLKSTLDADVFDDELTKLLRDKFNILDGVKRDELILKNYQILPDF